MNATLVQLKLREHQLLDELEQVWADIAIFSERYKFSDPLPPDIVINILKLMILDGHGDWLTTPVNLVNDSLMTSAEALKIAGYATGCSPHLLKGMLSRAQSKPVLVCREGKLILRVDS